jgi:cytochrome b subunit of formate dehydrogenase
MVGHARCKSSPASDMNKYVAQKEGAKKMWVVVVVLLVAVAAITGFMVGVAYGQEHYDEHV